MLLRRILLHIRSENWFAVFLDLVVVVAGLFIGLQVDTWWSERQDARLGDVYLSEIQEDFELNKSRLELETARLEDILRNLAALYEQSVLASPVLPVTDLNDRFRLIADMPVFIPVTRAYTNLTGSGDLKLLRSRKLKNELADYYSAAEVTLIVQNTHEMELVQIYEPYIIKNLDYAAVQKTRVDDFSFPPPIEESRILSVLGTAEFRNVLTQKWVISADLLDQQRKMLVRTNQVLQTLQSIIDQ